MGKGISNRTIRMPWEALRALAPRACLWCRSQRQPKNLERMEHTSKRPDSLTRLLQAQEGRICNWISWGNSSSSKLVVPSHICASLTNLGISGVALKNILKPCMLMTEGILRSSLLRVMG
jgi:hypothetical protein